VFRLRVCENVLLFERYKNLLYSLYNNLLKTSSTYLLFNCVDFRQCCMQFIALSTQVKVIVQVKLLESYYVTHFLTKQLLYLL